MKINSIRLSNFLPFGSDVDVVFPDDRDLMLLVNGVNGVGKTALFEAVYWALRGTTVREIQAAGVLRHGTKQCTVEVDIDEHIIKRVWSKAKKQVWLNDQSWHVASEGTAAIVDQLGFDPDLLGLVAFCGRRFDSFVSMKPPERAHVIGLISNASRWDQVSRLAGKKAREAAVSLREARKANEELVSDIANREQEIGVLEWDLKTQTDQQQKKLASTQEELDVLHQNIEVDEQTKKKLAEHVANTEKLLKGLDDLIQAEEQELRGAKADRDHLEADAREVEDLLSKGECPTCGQSLDAAEHRLHEEVEDHRAKLKELYDIIEQTIKDLSKLMTDRDELEKEMDRLEDNEKRLSDTLWARHQKLKDLEILKAEQSFDAGITRLEERLDTLRGELTKKQNALALGEDRVQEVLDYEEAYKFWQEGFKRIRYNVMERVAQGLSKALTSAVVKLGLDADSARVSLWAPDSRGDKKPQVGITLIRDEHEVAVEALSDGEEQRIGFACFVALGTYIKKVTGFDPGFRVIDEPFSNLDEDGRFRAFNAIEELHGQKFVMSHNPDFKERFTNEITVVKEGRVSRVL